MSWGPLSMLHRVVFLQHLACCTSPIPMLADCHQKPRLLSLCSCDHVTFQPHPTQRPPPPPPALLRHSGTWITLLPPRPSTQSLAGTPTTLHYDRSLLVSILPADRSASGQEQHVLSVYLQCLLAQRLACGMSDEQQ
uniref:Secreted protein n=1 Tax=Pipistrellus kuhlii TaxID=59472 RepID=A0A7J8A9K8_PIPKU|nr:hypothetical protein mPipKuh1_009006 [Pipistrellus kuhlii]